MTFRIRWALPLIGLLLLPLAVALATPSVARADSLTWATPWVGPANTFSGDVETPIATALNAVSFADATHGWAVGLRVDGVYLGGGSKSSYVAFSGNGGASWSSQSTPASQELHGVLARSATDVWAVGDAGTLLHYNGILWSAVTVDRWPSNKSLRAIAFSGLTGWAVGDGLGVACTINGGATWSTIAVPITGATLRGVAAIGGASAIAVGDGGVMRVLSSSTSSYRSSGTGSNLGGVSFADPTNGWAVGDDATFVRTTNGGSTWTAVPIGDPTKPSPYDLRSVAFADASNGIAVGTSQGVWRTIDGGAHWSASRIVDGGLGSYDLKGIGFVAANADVPVAVGRVYGGVLTQGTDKARAYRGTWSRPDVDPPTTTSDAKQAYTTSATISLTATDNAGSGVAHTYYRLDNAAPVEGLKIEVATGGEHTLEFWSVDVATNEETPHNFWTFTVTIPDTAAPVTTSDAKQSYDGPAAISLTATDTGGSGVAHTYYLLDNDPRVEGLKIEVPGEGEHTLEFWSVDVATNEETPHKYAAFSVVLPPPPDLTPPTTTPSSAIETTYADSAVISLRATDNVGGSGVAHTYYVLDDVRSEGLTVRTSAPGTHSLTYWSIDVATNEEIRHGPFLFTVTVTDRTPPVTNSDAVQAYTGSATIKLSATDNIGGAGVGSTYYILDGGVQRQGLTVNVSGAGAHKLEFWSVDAAPVANTEAHKFANFSITVVVPPDPPVVPPVAFKPVYRFHNLKSGYYLYSADEAEKANIIAKYSGTWKYEGPAYQINTANPLNGSPLWRFVNIKGGFYLYTAGTAEKDNIVAKFSKSWRLEGPAYGVSTDSSGVPVWRFRNKADGTYLYTADPAEKDNIVAKYSKTWQLEGPAYYLAP
ncbi:MAG TPA: YCF48-related protein [Coriobacteriia bacterium]